MSKDIHIVFQVLNFIHGPESEDFHLNDCDKLVLINLASHKGDKGIFPSMLRMAKELGKGESTIRRSIAKLRNIGLLLINYEIGKTNQYTINLSTAPLTDERSQMRPRSLVSDDPAQIRAVTPLTSERLYNKVNNKENNKYIYANDDSLFDDFWNAYPRKRNKEEARRIWKANEYDKIAKQIIDDVRNRMLNDTQWRNLMYINYPEKYLKNKCWEDDVDLTKIVSRNESNIPVGIRICGNL